MAIWGRSLTLLTLRFSWPCSCHLAMAEIKVSWAIKSATQVTFFSHVDFGCAKMVSMWLVWSHVWSRLRVVTVQSACVCCTKRVILCIYTVLLWHTGIVLVPLLLSSCSLDWTLSITHYFWLIQRLHSAAFLLLPCQWVPVSGNEVLGYVRGWSEGHPQHICH